MPEGDSHPVIFGEIGSQGTSFFNPMFHSFMFDLNNRLHFVTPVATTPSRNGYDRLIYAYLGEDGTQWKKIDGSVIPGLPLRGADGQPNQGDIVGDSSVRYNWQAKLVPSKNGHPLIRAKNPENYIWWAWDGGKWTLGNSVNSQSDVPHTGNTAPGGKIILHLV